MILGKRIELLNSCLKERNLEDILDPSGALYQQVLKAMFICSERDLEEYKDSKNDREKIEALIEEIANGAGWCSEYYVIDLMEDLTWTQRKIMLIRLAEEQLLYDQDEVNEDRVSIPSEYGVNPYTVNEIKVFIKAVIENGKEEA